MTQKSARLKKILAKVDWSTSDDVDDIVDELNKEDKKLKRLRKKQKYEPVDEGVRRHHKSRKLSTD